MNKLNRFFVIFCTTSSLSLFSQIGSGGFKIENDETKPIQLPEVLLSFDAILTNNKVEFTWASNTELNNNLFTIEKSKDAVHFEQVTSIKSFGNYSTLISYFDVDYAPFDGISYYRLKQTDKNGQVLSSRLVSVNNKYVSNHLIVNTTAINEETDNLLGSENNEVLVVLRNDKGLESYSKVIIDSDNNVVMPSDSDVKLDYGTYTVVASSNNKLYSQKVVVR